MPGDTEIITQWRNLAEVDYFSQFIKIWIAFNAWMRTLDHTITKDRALINKVKADGSRVKRSFESLLKNNDQNSIHFKALVAGLHISLENVILTPNDGAERVSFTAIQVMENLNAIHTFSHNNLIYRAEKKSSVWEVEIIARNRSQKYFRTLTTHSLTSITSDINFQNLSQSQRSRLETCFQEINPRKPTNLILNGVQQVGGVRMIDDFDLLFKGVVEILYLIRCALFHGRVVPNSEMNRVYKHGYEILYVLLESV